VSKRVLALYVLAAIGLAAGLAGSWHLTNIIIHIWPWLPRVMLTLTIFFCGIWGVRKVYKSLNKTGETGRKMNENPPTKSK
jgi:hypothetical protein